jgi:hypothetical protein
MIGGDYDTPIMYQDLANSTMNPFNIGMGGMYGGGIGTSSYLGGVQMRPQLDHDKVQLMHKKDQEGKRTLKKALLAIGGIIAIGFIPVISKGIKKSGGIGGYMKKLWNGLTGKTPAPAPTPAPAKPSLWQRFKNVFKKKPKTGSTTP